MVRKAGGGESTGSDMSAWTRVDKEGKMTGWLIR